MNPAIILFIVFLIVFGLFNRINSSKTGASNQPEKYNSTSYEFPEPVTFDIKEISSTEEEKGQRKIWLATYDKQGTSTNFTIELLLKELTENQLTAFSKGSIRRGEGDSTLLLQDLGRALDTTKNVNSIEKQNEIIFTVAILGTELSKNPTPNDFIAGSFSQNPKGDWIVTKIFLGDGSGEVYLNLNPVEQIGEFSIKDPEYGDVVISELSKVL